MSTKSKSGGKPATPAAKSSKSKKPADASAALPARDPFTAMVMGDAPKAKPSKKPAKAESKKPEPKPAKKAAKPAAEKRAEATGLDGRLHKSQVDGPVKAMWDLCESMKGARRKDVLAKAAEQGIAFYTARTQYQLWSRAVRDSEATVRAAAAGKSSKK